MKNSKLIDAWNCATPANEDKKRMLQNIQQKASATRESASRGWPFEMQTGAPWRVNRRSLVLGVLILGLLSVSAFAISQRVRLVDWRGNPAPEEDFASVMTAEETALMQARAVKAKELIKNAPDDEIWMAEIWEETQVTHYIKTKCHSLEQMKQYVKGADQELLIPAWIPDGYHFVSGELSFFVSKKTYDAGLEQLGEETTDDGILIKKFRALGPYESDIESYGMIFSDEQGNRLMFGCYRDQAGSRYSFNLGAEGKSEAVSVTGMAEGLYTQDTGFPNALHLKKEGMSPKTYYPWPIPYTYSAMDDRPAVPFDYDSAAYTIRADHLGKEQLLAIAESLK